MLLSSLAAALLLAPTFVSAIDQIEARNMAIHDLLESNTTALLVVDMQNDFCHESGVNRAVMKWPDVCSTAVQPIASLVESARQVDIPVIWINADYHPDNVNSAFDAKLRQRGEAGRPAVSEWGKAIIDELNPASSVFEERGTNEIVISKPSFDAFTDTPLKEELQRRNIETVVVTGVATSICVESTVRSALFEGFHVVVVKDGVGDLPERTVSSLDRVQLLFGHVTSALNIIGSWLPPAAEKLII
mmetsp:Transcript_1065/g.1828  ORF Transcript_1065/g.1828 Transcript_1065/m.1828 type:complete len:246 (+) Transcript_1065:32-769(+)